MFSAGGVDVQRTAQGSGFSFQKSLLKRFYAMSDEEYGRSDEMIIGNRLADMPKLIAIEKSLVRSAVWEKPVLPR